MKDYRFLGEEAEILGQRLDAARGALARSKKNTWAHAHWTSIVERLLFQWRQLPILHDGDARVTIIPRWTIDYNYYEKAEEPVRSTGIEQYFSDKIHNMGLSDRLAESWERNREMRLARAQ